MQSIGLVLEGGGLRGLYTAGVLDAFLDHGIRFEACIGVSAGVCNALSYLSRQRGRSLQINLMYMHDKRYFGFHNLVSTGCIFGAKMMFDTIPHELVPFDYDAYEACGCTLLAGVTDIETGGALYYDLCGLREKYDIVRATTSLPFISRIVHYDGKALLDGGLIDPIPIKKSIADGHEKNVVVLTQHKGYRKRKTRFTRLHKIKYRDYPRLVELMQIRHRIYNDTLVYLNALERQGKAFVIRPSQPLDASRLERDNDKLVATYALGFSDTVARMAELKAFLGMA